MLKAIDALPNFIAIDLFFQLLCKDLNILFIEVVIIIFVAFHTSAVGLATRRQSTIVLGRCTLNRKSWILKKKHNKLVALLLAWLNSLKGKVDLVYEFLHDSGIV